MRRITLLAVVAALLASSSAWAQDGRARRVQQKPAAAVSVPKAAEPASSALAFASVPFAPGESLSYDVDWNGQTAAAQVALSVGNKGTYFGQEGLPLSADIQTVGLVKMFASVNLSFKSYSDPRTLLPYRADRDQSVNGKTERGSIDGGVSAKRRTGMPSRSSDPSG